MKNKKKRLEVLRELAKASEAGKMERKQIVWVAQNIYALLESGIIGEGAFEHIETLMKNPFVDELPVGLVMKPSPFPDARISDLIARADDQNGFLAASRVCERKPIADWSAVQAKVEAMWHERSRLESIDSLILSGGGAKGFAYTGVVSALEDRGVLKNIKRVAGASAGALIGLPVALGYSASEVTEIVDRGRFGQFFYESTVSSWPGSLLIRLIGLQPDNSEIDLLKSFHEIAIGRLASLLELAPEKFRKMDEADCQGALDGVTPGEIWNTYRAAIEDLDRRHPGASDRIEFNGMRRLTGERQALLTAMRMERDDSIADADIIEAYLGDLIQDKLATVPDDILASLTPPIGPNVTARRNLSLHQLSQLARRYPEGGFKQFSVSMCALRRTPLPSVVTMLMSPLKWFWRLEEASAVSEHRDMPIKKACRASMNLPVVFKAQEYRGMRLFDGGILANHPREMLSRLPGYDPRRAIGFTFASESDLLGAPTLHDFMAGKGGVVDTIHRWKNAPNIPTKTDYWRTGIIATGTTEMAAFSATAAEKATLHKQGRITAHAVIANTFDPESNYESFRRGILHELIRTEMAALGETPPKAQRKQHPVDILSLPEVS